MLKNMTKTQPPSRDRDLIQIVDAALAEVTRKSGSRLACRPGCTQCCVGPFRINQLDAARLRQGLRDLREVDPQRARRVSKRAEDSIGRISRDFPGDPITGVLDEGPQADEKFADFANYEPCPVLDPETGLCDLYESRPMTCRVFGPPVRSEEGLGVCELCFQGESAKQIADCEMIPDPNGLEEELLSQMEIKGGKRGETIVAFCLVWP
jgi:Fe-S-cluster containining protein